MPTKYFFALMSQGIDNDLMRLQSRVQHGTLVPKQNLHVTLAFIGTPKDRAYPREELTEVGNDLENMSRPVYTGEFSPERADFMTKQITFGQVEYWSGSKCLVLTPVDGVPVWLSMLHSDLYSMLGKHGFGKTSDYPSFRPHITLAKPVSRTPAHAITKVSPIRMQVFDFSLIESIGGGRYNLVKRWHL